MGIKFFDFENDGDLDLILTDMHSDMSLDVTPGLERSKSLMMWEDGVLQGRENNLFGNAFYLNPGTSGAFEERSDELGAENYWPWGVSVGDLNADGWQDVFIASSMNFPFRYATNSLLLNDRGQKLLAAEFLLGVEPRDVLKTRPWYDPNQPWNGTKRPWFELDCTGYDARHPLCRNRTGKFEVMANVGSRSSAILDLDDDGDLDIVTNEFNDVPQVLISDLAQRRPIRWLQVALVGHRSNRQGLGAMVQVHAGGGVYTQQMDGKSGYLTQSAIPLYFGLGNAAAIDRIVVRWPSGTVQTVTEGLSINTQVAIEEP
jgi:hypothetical protein